METAALGRAWCGDSREDLRHGRSGLLAEDILKPIVSPNTRIRHPEYFEIGEFSIVDDFSYFSTRVRIGRCSHIASGCSIGGGSDRQFILGVFCCLSLCVQIWST